MKTFKQKLSPTIVIAIVVVVGLIVGGYFVFGGGGGTDDESAGAPKPVLTPEDLKSGQFRGRRILPPPRRRSRTSGLLALRRSARQATLRP